MGRVKQLYVADEPSRAHVIAGMLRSLGIEVEVVGDQPFWSDGSLVPKDMRPTLWVADEDFERAAKEIAAIEDRPSVGSAWTCADCGESGEESFDACWKCGAGRT